MGGLFVIEWDSAMNHVCSFCGNKHFVEKQVQYIYRHNNRFFVVNDVPCQECTYCGERYYDGPVLERIENEFQRIYGEGKKPPAEISVPVESFKDVPA
jgi:YgiT-type zinc finger domain-containing protein